MVAIFKNPDDLFSLEHPTETYNVSPSGKSVVLHPLNGTLVITRWHLGNVPVSEDQKGQGDCKP
jgi:hypothetical protein